MTIRVGINGFGRIGRNYLRAAKEQGADIEVVGINDLTDNETLAHLLRYDSVHGRFAGTVEVSGDGLVVDGREVTALSVRDPKELPWKDLVADIVIESTGMFRKRDQAQWHIDAGASKVIIYAPAKNEDLTVVMGANEGDYDPDNHHVLSNASCTTNSVVPLAKVLDESFGLARGFMTTVHAYTADQNVQDGPHSDLRRARAAAHSIVPTTTGAAVAATLALPQLEGKLDGQALRVPVIDGSITDLVATLAHDVTVDEVNDAFKAAADGPLAGLLEYSTAPLVSADIIHNPASCIFDSPSTMAMGNQVKVFGWYDNEWGYSSRLVDFTQYIAERM
jgi:glyceraldehyde 3-phosphate dehydrogenase